MKKKVFIGVGVLAGIIVFSLIYNAKSSTTDTSEVLAEVKFGEFVIDVTTSGELEAKNSVKVMASPGLMRARIYQIKIDDIVEEGTVVKKGEYIARLDETALGDMISKEANDLDLSYSKYTQTKLDTALDLRKARDEIINFQFAVEEKQLTVDQSKFEAPATQQQEKIALEKAVRTLSQAKESYKLKLQKAVAQMKEAGASLTEDRMGYDRLMKLQGEFVINAPEDGMVIYTKNRDGTKIKGGSDTSPFRPIATLPDLTKMISKTYVNEVDIRVVEKGQMVELGLDAFPDKKLTGEVISVANVGEQKPNSDAKVFQVDILVSESDTTLRPSMTTSNKIIASAIPEMLFIPLEALHSQGDTLDFVFLKSGMSVIKKEVKVGQANSDEVLILDGLKKGELVHLSNPEGLENKNFVLLEVEKSNSATEESGE